MFSSRVVWGRVREELVYVMATLRPSVAQFESSEGLEKYRRSRIAHVGLRAHVLKLHKTSLRTAVGIASEPFTTVGKPLMLAETRLDLIYIDLSRWSEEDRKLAEQFQDRYVSRPDGEFVDAEYPVAGIIAKLAAEDAPPAPGWFERVRRRVAGIGKLWR